AATRRAYSSRRPVPGDSTRAFTARSQLTDMMRVSVEPSPAEVWRRDAVMPDITEHAKLTGAALDRRLKRLGLTQDEDGWTDRYLLCEHIVDPETARVRQRFESVARFIRDLIAHRWVKTRSTREQADPKRVYYLSMEFLIGRALNNNV